MQNTVFRILVAEPGPPAAPSIAGVIPAVEMPRPGASLDVVYLHDGAETVSALTRGNFDYAILNTSLPGLEPRSVLDKLAQCKETTPVVFVCDRPKGEQVALRRRGAVDCLHPSEISSDRVAATIWSAVRLKTAQDETRKAEKRATASRFDTLTKLHSRSQFIERLEEAISLASREGKEVALLLMDLNRFRDVNETLGHRIGDLLLEEVAGRVRLIFRTSDLVARFGDDEFAVLLQTGAATKGAVTAAGKLLQAMQEPFLLDEHHFLIGTSIGIANYPTHGLDSRTLLRHAEFAMRAAKRDANGFVVYSGQGETDTVGQLSLSHDLRTAIEQDQLVLNYQPVITMNTGRICGVESLLRWAHPNHGTVTPNVFIPLAEQTGTIDALTAWVLNKALEQSAQWRSLGTDLRVSVNLSPLTLHNIEFADTVATIMKRWNATPENLVLEITESAIISDAVRATETVERLHDLGVGISIDDFGSGYSSLAHIRKLPVSELKVDKSYVMNITTEQDDLVIVRTLVELGHNLGLTVVGEGVEDAETWNILSALGCDFGQGFYMGRPMEADVLAKWLHESPWGTGQEKLRRAAR